MAEDKSYKEILVKLTNSHIKEYESKYFLSDSLIQTRNPNCYGVTFSMENCLSYMLVQENEIIIKNITTVNVFQKASNQNYITFTRIMLNSAPIKNIIPLYFNKKEYFLIVFTKSNIQTYLINIDFNTPNKKNLMNCNFNKNILSIASKVEFCGKSNDNTLKFCIGCENGKIFSAELFPDFENYELVVKKVKEIGFVNKGFFSYFTSSFLSKGSNTADSNNQNSTNKKGNKSDDNNPVNSLHYLGNNVVAVLRTNYLFELININSGTIFYSEYLFDNIDNKDFIDDSKILSTVDYSFTNDELKSTRRKVFYVFIYINSFNMNSLLSFQLMFIDIPMNNLTCTNNDYNNFFSNIDIGTNVKLKNRNNILIYGEIIDMIINNNKLWMVYLNKNNKSEFLLNKNGNEENNINYLNETYGLKIINVLENNVIESENEINDIEERDNSQEREILVNFNEKNLFYLLGIINQLGYNLNGINNISKSNELDENPSNTLEQNKIIFTCLQNEKYFLTENLIDFINIKFHQGFKNKNLCFKFLEEKYLTNNSQEEIGSIINEIILPLIQKELYMNQIISLGCFKNNDLDSVTFIRQRELSFINVVDSFEKINDYIKEYEYQIRKFNSDENMIKEFIHSNLSSGNKNSPMLLIFALNRIYLTEINLKIKNEKFLKNVFAQKNLEQFKNDIIKQNLSCQMNPFNNLEFINELINEIYISYKDIIEENIKNLFTMYTQEFENIQNQENFKKMLDDLQNIRNSQKVNTININNKYCEIITKIILSRIDSLYNISNDIFCFKQWLNLYEDIISLDTPFDINENDIDKFYINNLILYILCNHLTFFNSEDVARINIDNVGGKNNDILNDKIVTWIEKFVFNKFSQLGYDILTEQKNKFINYAICLILNDINLNNTNNSNIIKELVENKDYDLLNLYNSILLNSKSSFNINIRDSLKLLIICNAANDEITQLKNNLIYLYQKYPQYDIENFEDNDYKYINNIKNYYIQLRNYLKSPNIFISKKTLQNFYLLNYDLLFTKLVSFLENNFDFINDNDENNINNIDNCLIYILTDLIDSCFSENEDLCLIIYAKIENIINNIGEGKHKKKIFNKIKDDILSVICSKVFESFISNNKQITSTIIKLSKLNKDLLNQICQLQENNLTYDKNLNNNSEINNSLFDINNSNMNMNKSHSIIENKINVYHFLITCYNSLMKYEQIITISKAFNNIIEIHLSLNNVNLEELIYFYTQEITSIKNQINAYYKKKQLNSFISSDENDLEKINKEKIIIKMKIDILKYYASNIRDTNDEIPENEILKIKNDNSNFVDYIFEFNILKDAIEADLVKCLDFKEAKLFIYNLLNCLVYDTNNKTNEDGKLLDLFIRNIYFDNKRYNDEYMFITLEIMLKLNHSYLASDNLEKILKTLEFKNKVRLQEMLYSLSQG